MGRSACDTSDGSVYTTGFFGLTADFDPGPATYLITAIGVSDMYVSKLDSNGNFAWAKAYGGVDSYVYSNNITIDRVSGDVYITGYIFQGNAEFEEFDLDTGVFILKLDSDGNVVWAKSLESAPPDYLCVLDIVVDQVNSNVYMIGAFYGTVDFDPGPDTFALTSVEGSYDIFISKLDTSGNFVWVKGMGGTGGDYGVSLAVDSGAGGSFYTTGSFQGIVDFDPGPDTFALTADGPSAAFISKLDVMGNFIWARAMNGSGSGGGSIALDAYGHVYTAGSYFGMVDFDPGPDTFNLTSVEGSYDIFISKLDTSGNFVWANGMGGIGSDYANSLAVAPGENGRIYTTGYSEYISYLDAEMFIYQLSNSGDSLWAQSASGTPSLGISLCNDASGNIIFTGVYGGSFTLGNITFIHIQPEGYGSNGEPYWNVFIAKLDASSFPCPGIVTNTADSGAGSLREVISCTSIGDTIIFSLPPMSEIILTSGEIVIQKNLTLSGLGNVDLSISGNNASRIFHILPGKALTIENLSLKNAASIMNGGAIFVEGNLTLDYVTLENNFQNGIPKGLTVNSPGGLVTINGLVDIKN